MAFDYECTEPGCTEKFSEDTAAGLIQRAAAHHHDHHGGPPEITPEIEAAIRGAMTES